MLCTRLLSKNVLACRQAMVFVGKSRFSPPNYESGVLTSVVLNRNLYQTTKRNNQSCKKGGTAPPPSEPESKGLNAKLLIAVAAVAGLGVIGLLMTKSKEEPKETPPPPKKIYKKCPASSSELPNKVPYLLVGGGTASFSAFRAIKSNDPKAKVLVISDELVKPYMRPPLSKELWYSSAPGEIPTDYRFKQWTGAERSLFFEPDEFFVDPTKLDSSENGGIAVAQGYRVKKIDPKRRIATLTDGYEIKYDNCLLATGCSPKTLPVFENAPKDLKSKIMIYRTPEDFERLKRYADEKKSITIVGSGFLGSELACALAVYSRDSPIRINQIYQESGNMGRVLPEYLSKWTTRKIEELGVCVLPSVQVKEVSRDRSGMKLSLSNGQELSTDIAVICVGCEANTDIATLSGLEVDSDIGGFVVNAELEARQNLFVAGDASCFYDPLLGRRRVEHHDHSVVSGRLAGENMVAKDNLKKPYEHQSMFWSDLGSGLGYEGIGRTEASLPTVGVFAYATEKDTEQERKQETVKTVGAESAKQEDKPKESIGKNAASEEDDYGKGVIFYLQDDKVVGILLWNLFNRIGLARTVINQNTAYKDLNEVAKLFDIHS